jgi:Ca-activated chloride channel family protein
MNFAQPAWLVLIILLPLLGLGALLATRLRRQQWQAFVAPRLRDSLLKHGSGLSRWLALFFLIAACAAIIIALAGPRGDAGTRVEKTMGRNVMIALDLSRSMRVADVKPDRLTQAKVVIYELLEAMPNERIGLIGFAGDPHVYAPLTTDHGAVRETVEQIDEEWPPLGGSNLAAAVQLATDTLKKTGQKNNALVILSDGEKHDDDLDAMIAQAEQSGVYIIAIGVGTEDGGFVPHKEFPGGKMVDRSGRPVISQLQGDVMRQLAEGTKGRFAMAGSGLDIPVLVKSVVAGLDAFEMDSRERKISVEFYQWFMFPALVFLMTSIIVGTRWRGIQGTALLMLAGCLLTAPDASASEASKAKAALHEERHEEAREAYQQLAEGSKRRETRARYRLGEATAAYRALDFRAARTAFSQTLLTRDPRVKASGHLGMGNSLFQLGWAGLSGDSYPADAESLPDLDRFDTIVKEALAKLRESDAPEEGDTAGVSRVESAVTNWSDAVRHYESTLVLDPDETAAARNRQLTLTYLVRLAELLEQEKQEAEDSMPQPQPGEGEPQQGEGDGEGEAQDGDSGEEGPDSEQGKNREEPDEGEGEEENGESENQNKGEDVEESEAEDPNADPNESPEDRAHRILKENADLEKGPLSPGRREFRSAEKDW